MKPKYNNNFKCKAYWIVCRVESSGQDSKLRLLRQLRLHGGAFHHEQQRPRRQDLQAVVATVAPSAGTTHSNVSNSSNNTQ